jgi:NAD(P)-dependent dehydrogenase (short-subunit alcohol dehydrogenase family)
MNVWDMFSLKGKVALVTGGAGQFGKQIVTALSEVGAKIYIASRNFKELEQAVEVYRNEGYEVSALQFDLGDEGAILSLKEKIVDREGKIDVLVNNSNLKMMNGWEDDASAFTESMRVNATGLFMITRAFGNEMLKRGKGSIINIASINGMVGPDRTLYEDVDVPGYLPDYNFQKGGMINFTRFVASYYGPSNVRCNCISPAGLETERTPQKFVQNYKQRIFLGRMVNSTDLKGVIVFLASDASSFITGVNIPVDGGYTAK